MELLGDTRVRHDRDRSAPLVALLASLVAAGVSGAISGFLWGGVGGRIVMRILFLTSDERVAGLTSDDGFEIGRVSGDTFFLVVSMTVLGGILGVVYGVARFFIDGSTRRARLGIATAVGLFSGAAIVHTDGVDFRFLDPLWLSVGAFVALPALWAVTLVGITERLLHSTLPSPIPFIDARPFGRTGVVFAWTVIAVMTAVGLSDLLDDISHLT